MGMLIPTACFIQRYSFSLYNHDISYYFLTDLLGEMLSIDPNSTEI